MLVRFLRGRRELLFLIDMVLEGWRLVNFVLGYGYLEGFVVCLGY